TAASAAIPGALSALKESLQSVPLGAFNWRDLEEAVRTRQLLSAKVITERREVGDKVLRDLTTFGEGKLAMDKLRLHMATLGKLLDQRIALLSDELAEEREGMRKAMWLTSLAAWLLVVFAIGFWMRERQRRAQLFAELVGSHALLEERVLARTAALQAANARVRNFASESERLVELERTRLSREVHDQIGQIFTGIKMILRTLQPGSLAPEQQTALTQALDMGVKTTRRIAAELRPPLLDDLGLPQALDHYLKTCFSPLDITYALDMPDAHGLNDQQVMQLFRVVQEACTNICRHARASHVEITCHTTEEGLVLTIDDDGTGFDEGQVREEALGLVGIRERVQLMGGTVEFIRHTSGGTRVAVHLPAVHNGHGNGHGNGGVA
ncbi:MAG: sensor histidine kinase, partial [Burkholderiales bacterium]|nr:sensor histidine kinase [Burkholderiales bacterium]